MDPDIRKRLSELNKSSLKNVPLPTTAAEHRRKQKSAPKVGETRLEKLAPGDEVEAGDGRFLLIDRDLARVWDKGEEFFGKYRRFFDVEGIAGTPEDFHESWGPILECGAEDIAYLDIETCGFSGTPVFLVGVLQADADAIHIRQFFARDYSEEGPMLHKLWEELERFRALVTFNGKTFDYPFITERALFHRVPVRENCHHFDLLHEARRRYKGKFPDCKLQTLERNICCRPRYGDIPGEKIPAAYHFFVQSGNACQMQDVLHHNALDLLTMAEVVLYMLKNEDIFE